MADIDYRALLMKYMNHVGEQEGVYFLPGVDDFETENYPKSMKFSEKECDELEKVKNELDTKRREVK